MPEHFFFFRKRVHSGKQAAQEVTEQIHPVLADIVKLTFKACRTEYNWFAQHRNQIVVERTEYRHFLE